MTLNITMVSPWGIWQSSDHRLSIDGKTVDDRSIKHLTVQCPDGTALITYAGIGSVGGDHVSNWLRRLIRGEDRTVDQTLILIREEASRSLTPYARSHHISHVFSIGAFLNGRPWAAVIANKTESGAIGREFNTSAVEVKDNSIVLVTGMGLYAVSAADRYLLKKCASRKPHKPEDYLKLLGKVNERASKDKNGASISPGCLIVYVPPKGETGFNAEYVPNKRHLQGSYTFPIFRGIDMAEIMKFGLDHFRGSITDVARAADEAHEKAVAPDRTFPKK